MSVPDYLKSLEESLKNLMPPNSEVAQGTSASVPVAPTPVAPTPDTSLTGTYTTSST